MTARYLSWYLRDFTSMEQGQGVPNGGQFDVVIAPTELQTSLSAAYIGSDFVLFQRQATVEGEVAGAEWQDILRWWIFHQSRELSVQERLHSLGSL